MIVLMYNSLSECQCDGNNNEWNLFFMEFKVQVEIILERLVISI